jgi:hypothetical protein
LKSGGEGGDARCRRGVALTCAVLTRVVEAGVDEADAVKAFSVFSKYKIKSDLSFVFLFQEI